MESFQSKYIQYRIRTKLAELESTDSQIALGKREYYISILLAYQGKHPYLHPGSSLFEYLEKTFWKDI